MAKVAGYRMEHIERRGGRWYARLNVPAAMQQPLGRRKFRIALDTTDRATARRLAAPIVAEWQARITEAKGKGGGGEADRWRRLWKMATPAERDTLIDLIGDAALDRVGLAAWAQLDDPEEATEEDRQQVREYVATATGDRVPFTEHLAEYLATLTGRIEPKSQSMKEASIRRFAAGFKFTADVTRPAVQRWVNGQATGAATATVRRMLSELRGFWRYLCSIGAASEDARPFDSLTVPAARRSKDDKRQAFTPAQVVSLLARARDEDDGELADVVDIARWTGARIEEICALKIDRVYLDAPVPYFRIGAGKTEAAIREVPIHASLVPTLRRLIGGRNAGYVLAHLTANKYGDRSNSVGKRFGRLKTRMGFDSRYVFHSIRKAVATIFKDASVPEATAADILGHEIATMTYGLYAGNVSLAVKAAAIALLAYPAAE